MLKNARTEKSFESVSLTLYLEASLIFNARIGAAHL